MTLRLNSMCEVYNSTNGLTVYVETTRNGARWHAHNNFGRLVFCGTGVSHRSALIEIRKQIGQEINFVRMAGARYRN